MKSHSFSFMIFFLLLLAIGFYPNEAYAQKSGDQYTDLVTLFKQWRTFEKPPLREGAPDYTKETFKKRWAGFKDLQQKLKAIDTTDWPIAQQVDWHIINAEMNGYDFNQRVLQPWVRDPAYYKTLWMYRSDVPAHEGPTHHMTTELWTYEFPLSREERKRLLSDLAVISPLNAQAKINLTGNAKDLWIAGIRDIESQGKNLKNIKNLPGISSDKEILKVINTAIKS